jgi:hypothetical protein
MGSRRKLISLPGETDLARRQEDAINALSYGDDNYENYLDNLDPAKRTRIENSLLRRKHGMHTVAPISCAGPTKCPFFNSCPIPERDESGRPLPGNDEDYPLYRPCVFEMTFLQQKTVDYLLHLQVDPSNPIEMAIVNELAVIDLYKQRAMLVLANGDNDGDGRNFLKQDLEEIQGEHGVILKKTTQLHPVIALMNTQESRRIKLLESLMETRKAKHDVASKLGDTSNGSTLKTELEMIRKLLEKGAKETIVLDSKEKVREAIPIDDD